MMIRSIAYATTALAIVASASIAPAEDIIFQEEGGFIAIEIESIPPASGWQLETSRAGFSGSGYYNYVGGNSFGSVPQATIMTYRVRVDNPGVYNLRIRNQHNHPDHTEENDCWIRVNGNHHWDKLYNSLDAHNKWGWQSVLEERNHSNASFTLVAGDNTIQIAGRSRGFKIDRMHLYLNGVVDPLSLSKPLSPVVGSLEPVARNLFDGEPNGWSRGGQVGNFSNPGGGHVGDALELVTGDNTNTFGYWQSPEIALPDNGSPADFALFEVQYRMRATTGAQGRPHVQALVPQTRIRASRADFRETQEFVIESNGLGTYAPNNTGRRYRHFFSQADRNHVMRFYFDVLNFGGVDQADSRVYLDQVEYFNRTGVAPRSSTQIAQIEFRGGNTNGFAPITTPVFGAANLFADNRGLGMNASTTGNFGTTFGIWTALAGIPMNSSSLYEFRFALASDAAPANRDKIGTVRLRVNDSTYQSSVLGVYSSTNSSALLPVQGQPITHRLWYMPDSVLGTVNPIISIDYLFEAGLGDNKDISVFLETVTVIEHKL